MGAPTLALGARRAKEQFLDRGKAPQTGRRQIREGHMASAGAGAMNWLPSIHPLLAHHPSGWGALIRQATIRPWKLSLLTGDPRVMIQPIHSRCHFTTDSAKLFYTRHLWFSISHHWHYWHLGPDKSVLGESVLCIVGCRTSTTLSSIHKMP